MEPSAEQPLAKEVSAGERPVNEAPPEGSSSSSSSLVASGGGALAPGSDSGSGSIVVGVDGSASSKRAALWAARQALRCGSSLRIVGAWEPPYFGPEAYEYRPPEIEADALAADRARRTVAEIAEAVSGILPADQVSTEVHPGGPAEVLIEQSKDAELLVVGSRGLGGFRGLLLGSVSHQVASHALCPVVVVREEPAASTRP